MKFLILPISIKIEYIVLNDACIETASKYDDCKSKQTSV